MNWIRKNKLTTVLILIVAYFVFKGFFSSFLGVGYRALPIYEPRQDLIAPESAPSLGFQKGILPPPSREYAPTERTERLVVEESSMSLVVLKVQEMADKITDYAKTIGGFMVSSSLSRPEDSPFATVVVRVPSDRFRETIAFFRSLAIKVTSENIKGTDVTDEYVDIQARLTTLEKTKLKFQEIMDQTREISDILNIQRELINLQDQIDSLKGRQNYLEQTAKLAKITVYLSTDELALPYAPVKVFRPQVIFKLAVRSLMGTLQKIATLIIWVGVYSVIWLPILLVILYLRKRGFKKPINLE